MERCILVIDDEQDIHKIAEIGLTLTTDWTVLTATSGQVGFELAVTTQPDAILLDAMMPGQDGVTTLQQLQGHPSTQAIPIIIFTAKNHAASRLEFYRLGAKGIITKPFDPITLASQVAGFLAWSSE